MLSSLPQVPSSLIYAHSAEQYALILRRYSGLNKSSILFEAALDVAYLRDTVAYGRINTNLRQAAAEAISNYVKDLYEAPQQTISST